MLAQKGAVPIEFIGVHDRFGQSGTLPELTEEYKLGASHIIEAAKKAVSRKK